MAGGSAAELILFIAAIVIAASVAGTLTSEVDRVSDAISAKSLDVSAEIRADAEIVSDPGAPVYNRSGDENVTIHVRNTGVSDLPAESGTFDVLLDGEYQTDLTVSVVDGGDTWHRGDVVKLEFAAPDLPAGDHRLKLVVRGDEEVFRFRT
ncbi:flagellar protein G [Halobaculum gomorrense]|uniref:Flagellar protein FlaG n=1 Tax=Halobaculum gomorrense TaxID=43928 RepID=A0A1M5Q8R1_9EURY|nr:flagellar protein G [Halobaculum gomorrense]SHH10392.1 flagellar protein FlaG [Halobaculum gomorrense]